MALHTNRVLRRCRFVSRLSTAAGWLCASDLLKSSLQRLVDSLSTCASCASAISSTVGTCVVSVVMVVLLLGSAEEKSAVVR
jgi:hypothetical protein